MTFEKEPKGFSVCVAENNFYKIEEKHTFFSRHLSYFGWLILAFVLATVRKTRKRKEKSNLKEIF